MKFSKLFSLLLPIIRREKRGGRELLEEKELFKYRGAIIIILRDSKGKQYVILKFTTFHVGVNILRRERFAYCGKGEKFKRSRSLSQT